ncbi:hypothetical protein AWB82_06647 [Caballeronia glebae]|uniref:Uncharacterized protein n=1 Tax=Caballeronia glebae TaxID=1777143 RepID=A0A158DE07_9BURK|nr:hypothetical protein [Caballeronia glebae]SAK92798.1 hypothetical protein AWB82_06647 [Caballeronia glebae]
MSRAQDTKKTQKKEEEGDEDAEGKESRKKGEKGSVEAAVKSSGLGEKQTRLEGHKSPVV